MPTVNDMPRMTDYVRKGFNRRKRPWDQVDLPEWWGLATWAALFGLIAMVLIGAVLSEGERSGASEDTAGGAPRPAVQSINPYSASPSVVPESAAPTTPASTPQDPSPPSAASEGFAATGAVQVPMTGGGTAVVPAGARNVARAAAEAEATGVWTGIPLTAGGAPPKARPNPQGSVVAEVTVADPRVTGSNLYVFTAGVRRDPASRPVAVQIEVERGTTGYTASRPHRNEPAPR